VLWVHDILDVTPAPWQETSGARRRNSWRRRVFIDRETVEQHATSQFASTNREVARCRPWVQYPKNYNANPNPRKSRP
jgi:hypothetical protein